MSERSTRLATDLVIYLIMNNDVDLTLSRHGSTSNGYRHASKQPNSEGSIQFGESAGPSLGCVGSSSSYLGKSSM